MNSGRYDLLINSYYCTNFFEAHLYRYQNSSLINDKKFKTEGLKNMLF